MKEPYYFYYHSVWKWYIGVINVVNKGIGGSYLLKVQKLSISVYFITECPNK